MVRGMVAGAIAGLAGTFAMNEAQRAWTRVADGHAPDSAGGRHDARDWQERSEHQNSNELAAQGIAGVVLGRRLTRAELRFAAPLAHSCSALRWVRCTAPTPSVARRPLRARHSGRRSGWSRMKLQCRCLDYRIPRRDVLLKCIYSRWFPTSSSAPRQK